ncbi:MAG: ABC transporter permease subunit [Acidimicrobiia bacterium]|nr:ABC transporter permease subunit [Acidimicrobiia bacterium]MDH5616244.1 ABC transporter permease subunit [Acidimicrobiia bacterium]
MAVTTAPRRRILPVLRRHTLTFYAVLAFAYLFIPVLLVILFGFNQVSGRFNYSWEGFSLDAWRSVFGGAQFGGVPGLFDSLLVSLRLALLSALGATVLGTLIALALVRYRFRGRSTTNLLLFLPMATPEVVMGSSILALFLVIRFSLGFNTLLIAHILFNISYVVVTVKARLQGFDRHLEEAAMDLYANEWETFRRVTLPMIMPGVFAAFLLAFALSFDDFIISNFNSGQTVTFPLYIFGAAQRGIPPEVNVLGTLIFLVTVTIMLVNVWMQRRRA